MIIRHEVLNANSNLVQIVDTVNLVRSLHRTT